MSDLHHDGTGSAPSVAQALLDVRDLSISFRQDRRQVEVVSSVSLSVDPGEIVGLVGESGSGKTVTSMAVMGLLGMTGGTITGGSVTFDGRDMSTLSAAQWQGVRGRRISMIFQQPTRSLNPAFTVGEQIAEQLRVHTGLSRKAAWLRAVECLDEVGIPKAATRAKEYPHTFSGGMCQRVMIASALSCSPQLLIADEPTTALDVTVQARILDLLRDVQDRTGIGILYVTHDLGVVAQLCDRVTVMYGGQSIESTTTRRLMTSPAHPYSQGLLDAVPKPGSGRRLVAIPGQVPPPSDWPQGCRFNARCAYVVQGTCTDAPIPVSAVSVGHDARCNRIGDITLRGIGLPERSGIAPSEGLKGA